MIHPNMILNHDFIPSLFDKNELPKSLTLRMNLWEKLVTKYWINVVDQSILHPLCYRLYIYICIVENRNSFCGRFMLVW